MGLWVVYVCVGVYRCILIFTIASPHVKSKHTHAETQNEKKAPGGLRATCVARREARTFRRATRVARQFAQETAPPWPVAYFTRRGCRNHTSGFSWQRNVVGGRGRGGRAHPNPKFVLCPEIPGTEAHKPRGVACLRLKCVCLLLNILHLCPLKL